MFSSKQSNHTPKKFPKRKFWFSIVTLTILAIVWYQQEQQLRQQHVYMGTPVSTSWHINNWTRIFRNQGYLAGYSEWRKNPLWVSYKLNNSPPFKLAKRPKKFSYDWRSIMRVQPEDFTHSGFERGHLAPNYAIGVNYGKTAQYETFKMTNISPQRNKLNQKAWQRLEEVATNYFAKRLGEIWVITGPVFDKQRQYLPSGVEVPDAFYKIFIHQNSDESINSLTFLVPQDVTGKEPLTKFVTSIDHIETLTKIDFMPNLDDSIEEKVESTQHAENIWQLSDVASLKGHY